MRSRLPLFVGVAVVAVLAVGTFGFWYAFLRPVPPAVSPPGASAGTSAGAPAGAPASAAQNASTAASGGTAAGSDLSGTWTVDTSVGSFSDFSSSFVGPPGFHLPTGLASDAGDAELLGTRTPRGVAARSSPEGWKDGHCRHVTAG